MDSEPGWDWAKSFRMHVAAALIAGVPVSQKREPDMEELHVAARHVLARMLTAWVVGVNYQKGQPIDPGYPVAQTLSVEEFGCEKPVGIFVKRAELCRWINAIGLPSAYDFSEPAHTAEPVPENAGKWTPERLAVLRAYRDTHTMEQTTAEFGISEQRIRKLLPTKKPQAKPFAGLVHRSK